MSFFTTTDTGVTLNRFSQDLQLIDMYDDAAQSSSATLTMSQGIACLGTEYLCK